MSILCRQCGQRNADGTTFCVNPTCGAYLTWEGDRTSGLPAPPRPPEPPAGPRGPGPMPAGGPRPRTAPPGTARAPGPVNGAGTTGAAGNGERAGVAVKLGETKVVVEPGGTASTTLTIHNGGSRVEQFVVTVLGPAAGWTTVEPAAVPVYPGGQADCTLRFAPPRSSAVPAGPTWFGVRAASQVHAGLADQADGVVTVGPFRDLSVAMAPQRSRGRGKTVHRVRLRNAGNVVEPVRVEAADPDGVLRFGTPPGETQTPPGDHGADVLVRPPFRLFGRPRQYTFQVTVTPRNPVPPARLDGSREALALLPRWFAVLGVVLVLLGCLSAGVVAVLPTALDALTGNNTANNQGNGNQGQQNQGQNDQNQQPSQGQNNQNDQNKTHAQDQVDVDEGNQADLDEITVTNRGADIAFQSDDGKKRFVVPRNGAQLVALGQVDNAAARCAAASFGTDPVQADGFDKGDVLCVATSAGRLAVATVRSGVGDSPGTLRLSVTTFDR